MAALSAPGIGSNLDINGIVSQLMKVEQQPLAALAGKEAKFQAQLTAYGSLKGALSSFQSAVAALATPARFSNVMASIADSTVAGVTAASTAAPGSYSLKVDTLAQAQKLRSTAFAATTTSVGSGTLTVSFGTYNADTFTLNPDKASKTITIGPGQDSLAGIRDAINAASAGVTAGIINDGSGNRLVISSNDTGIANALRITVTDDDSTHTDTSGLSQLMYDARTISGTKNLTETVAAQNATLTIDGIAISKASNTISDAIAGVTLNLLKVNTPSTTTLTVSRDTAGIQSAVQSFVKAYNDLNKTITDLSKYDTALKKGSTLTGDSAVRSIQTQLRNVFNTALSTTGGGLRSLADAGLTFQKDGTLKLDSAKLSAIMNDATKDVSMLFAVVGKPSDSLVSFVGSTENTKDGTYALNISQLATQGKVLGGAAAALTINAAGNDTLNLTVDGVTASVTLAAGTYTAVALAAEIQSKINGVSALSSANIRVTVTESAGVLSITSNRYGASSMVAGIGGSAAAGIFGTPNYTNSTGLDAAGSIGGVAASGSGQTLTGAGDAHGLALTIAGGATGDRGTMKLARGYAYQLDKLVGRMLENNNLLDSRVDGITASIKDVGLRREELLQRLQLIEKRYRTQFNALDTMLSRMNQTSTYLTQQLASLPGSGKAK